MNTLISVLLINCLCCLAIGFRMNTGISQTLSVDGRMPQTHAELVLFLKVVDCKQNCSEERKQLATQKLEESGNTSSQDLQDALLAAEEECNDICEVLIDDPRNEEANAYLPPPTTTSTTSTSLDPLGRPPPISPGLTTGGRPTPLLYGSTVDPIGGMLI